MLIPTDRAPTHPGEALREDYLPDLGWTAEQLADRLRVPAVEVVALLAEERPVTPELALRLGRLFSQTPAFWLNLQQAYDLFHAQHSPAAREVLAIKPIRKVG